MKNRPAEINFLSTLLLAMAIGLPLYWAARPLRGQAVVSRGTATDAITTSRHSAQASRSFAAPLLNATKRQRIPQALQGLPLAFIENRGQADARAAFLVQGRDTTAYFTAQGLTLALTQRGDEKSARAKSNLRQRWNLKLDFIGANPAVLPCGKELANAQVSYFSGARENWRTGIRSYSSIVYANLWPGIDLIYSGTTDRLKYEFIVKPGADPRQIRLSYRGTNAPLAVNEQGQLEIATPFCVIRDDKPVSHQGSQHSRKSNPALSNVGADLCVCPGDGAPAKAGADTQVCPYAKHRKIFASTLNKQIKTEFVVYERAADGSQAYGFRVGKYDRRKTLVIDPAILVYAGFIGGSGDDEGHSIAVDGAGNAYVTGVTTSTQATFPEVAGPDLTYNGRTDAFVAKLKADGSGLVYCGYIGGDGDDAGHSVAIDASGNAYVTGWTTSTQATFPVLGTLDPTFNGAIDAFVAKVNATGTALGYCGYVGGDDEDEALGIAVDGTGRAYLTGLTASTEATFPKLVGPGLLFKGAVDAFVARVKADGSGLEYAGYLGGTGDDQGRSIAVDTGGNAYVAGLTTSTEASFTMVGTLDPSFNGGTDAFVAKLNPTGSAISYSGFIGGSGIDEAYGIAVDGAGNAYITGRTTSSEATFPKLIGPDLSFNGGLDAFVAKINPAGSALSYAGYIGGSGDDEGFGIAVDSAGNAYVTGRTTSSETTFPKANAFDLTLNGSADGFIAKLTATGNALNYAGYLGGNGLEEGFGTTVNGLRQVYVAGRSTSADTSFPTLVGPGLKFGGAADAFAMRIDDSSIVCPTLAINPATLPNGVQGGAYNQSLTGTGGTAPYSFTIISGALPGGLALSAAGSLSGAAAQSGGFNFTVMTTDAIGCTGTRAYTLVINPCPTITLNPATLPASTTFTFYSQTITANGGTAPYSFSLSAGALPAGLNLSAGGALSGAPTAAGVFNFTLKATDANLCLGTQAYTLTLNTNPGLLFYPLAHPVRLLDTRPGQLGCFAPQGPIPGNTSRIQPARGLCDGLTIPNNALALTGNITTVESGGGYLTLYPSDAAQPLVANSNYGSNEVLNNVFTVGLGNVDGAFKIFVTSTTNVVIDVTGYYAPPGAGGLYFHPLPKPIRLLETRAGETGCTTPNMPLPGAVDTSQQARLTCDGVTIPPAALAIVGNATTVNPGGGYLTLFPADAARPLVASSNYSTGQVMNAPFTVGLSAAGQFKIYPTSQTDLVIDVLGYYSADALDQNGAGLLFNALPHPVRLLETRAQFTGCYNPGLPLAGGSTRMQPARGVCDGVTIAANALGIVGNATVVNSNGGYLTFWPSTAAQPLVATSNFTAGQVFNRHFTVGLGQADGAFKIFTFFSTDLVIDVSGYFAP